MKDREVSTGWVIASIVFGIATLFLYNSNDHKNSVIEQVKSKNAEVQAAISNLKDKVDNFSDGSTDWKEVVGDVENATKELESAADDLSDEIDEFDVDTSADN